MKEAYIPGCKLMSQQINEAGQDRCLHLTPHKSILVANQGVDSMKFEKIHRTHSHGPGLSLKFHFHLLSPSRDLTVVFILQTKHSTIYRNHQILIQSAKLDVSFKDEHHDKLVSS
jgi:hypothetical protein